MRSAMLALSNTMADVKEGFGDTVGAAQDRTGLIQQERASSSSSLLTRFSCSTRLCSWVSRRRSPIRCALQILDLQSQLEQNRLALYQNNIAIIDAMRQEVDEDRRYAPRCSTCERHG